MAPSVAPREIFTTWFTPDPDMNASDIHAECDFLVARNQMLSDFLKGDLDADTLLDAMEYYGVDPVQYVETVEDNVAALQDGEIELESGTIKIYGEFYEIL